MEIKRITVTGTPIAGKTTKHSYKGSEGVVQLQVGEAGELAIVCALQDVDKNGAQGTSTYAKRVFAPGTWQYVDVEAEPSKVSPLKVPKPGLIVPGPGSKKPL